MSSFEVFVADGGALLFLAELEVYRTTMVAESYEVLLGGLALLLIGLALSGLWSKARS